MIIKNLDYQIDLSGPIQLQEFLPERILKYSPNVVLQMKF